MTEHAQNTVFLKKGNYQLITKRPKIYAHVREDKYDRIYVVITQTKADEVT